MHAVIVTFRLRGIAHEEFTEFATGVAPAFADIPGLVAKVWLADAHTGAYGGFYLFEDADAAVAYLRSELFDQAVTTNPLFTEVAVRRAAVIDAATAVTTPGLAVPVG